MKKWEKGIKKKKDIRPISRTKKAKWKKSLFYICTFCFQNDQNSMRSIFDSANTIIFLVRYEFIFLISFLYYLIYSIKRKRNKSRDAAWKALQFTKNKPFIYMHFLFFKYAKFCATKKWPLSQSRKLVAQTLPI
jgi:hypothetical protein